MPLRDRITVHTPRLEIHRGAFATTFTIFTPDVAMSIERRFAHCHRATLGALYDCEGALIDLSRRDGGGHGDLVVEIDPPWIDPARLDGRAAGAFLPGKSLFLGYFMPLYGHFLVETLSRFWATEAGPFDNYVFFPFRHDEGALVRREFHRSFLKWFGIPAHKITFLRSATAFEEIHVPEKLCTINSHASIHMAAVYRKIAQSFPGGTAHPRLFMSRQPPYERIANVAEIEALFRDLDFTILHPDRLDFATRIRLYANCQVMAGFAGSGLHNCLFCRAGTQIIELGDTRSPTAPLQMQTVLNQAAGVEGWFVPFQGSAAGELDTALLRRALLAIPLAARDRTGGTHDGSFAARSHAGHYRWPAAMTVHAWRAGEVRRTGRLTFGDDGDNDDVIEGLSITLDADAPFGIAYRAKLHDGTWTAWTGPGEIAGSRGLGRPLRGYAIRLESGTDSGFRCICMGRFAGDAAIIESEDGAPCQSAGGGYLSALHIQLRHASAP